MDTLLVHPREGFPMRHRVGVGVVCLQHHPSGDLSSSEPDFKVTRELVRAGQLVKV